MKSPGMLRALLWWTALVSGVLVWLPLVRGATQGAAYRWQLPLESAAAASAATTGCCWRRRLWWELFCTPAGAARGDRFTGCCFSFTFHSPRWSSTPRFATRKVCASKAPRWESTCRSPSPHRCCSAVSPASRSSGWSVTYAADARPSACPGYGPARHGFARHWSRRCSRSRRCCFAAETFRALPTSWASAWCSGSGS